MGSFLLTLGLVPFIKKLAFKVGAVDNPCQRKVHCKPMPRLGGLAIYMGFIVMVLLTQPINHQIISLVLGSTIIALLGVADDIKDISPKMKLAGQIVAACVLVAFNIDVSYITHPFIEGKIIPLHYLSIPVTILWVVGITNAVNLIDGLDGLAAGVSSIALITLSGMAFIMGNPFVAAMAAILAASTLGFLVFNFYPAKIFMGDTGSLAIGGIIAVFAILIRKELLIPILCGIFVIESLSVVMQVGWFKYTRLRFGEGRRIFRMKPDNLLLILFYTRIPCYKSGWCLFYLQC